MFNPQNKPGLWAYAAAVVTGLSYYSGFYVSDDISYLRAVDAIARGDEFGVGLGSARLAFVVPAGIIYATVSGSIFFTILINGLTYFCGIVFFARRVARMLHGPMAAAVAGFVVAFCPLAYRYVGALLPDVALTFWLAAWMSVLVTILTRPSSLVIDRRMAFLVVLLGVLNGVAYAVKESGLIVAVPGFLLIARHLGLANLRQVFFAGLLYACGLAAVFLVEFLALWMLTGQLTFRLGIVSSGQWRQHLVDLFERDGFLPQDRLARVYDLLSVTLGLPYLVFSVFTVIAYPLVKPRNLVVWWVTVWCFAYLTWGSASLTEYLPPPLVDRYYILLLPGIAVMAAHILVRAVVLLEHGVRAWNLQWLPWLAPVLVIVLGLYEYGTRIDKAGNIYRAVHAQSFMYALREANESFGELPVVLSKYTSSRMGPLLRWRCDPDIRFSDRRRCNYKQPIEVPFVFVAPGAAAFGESPPDVQIDALVKSPFDVTLHKQIAVPLSRIEQLRYALGPMLNSMPREPKLNQSGSYAVYLVQEAQPHNPRAAVTSIE